MAQVLVIAMVLRSIQAPMAPIGASREASKRITIPITPRTMRHTFTTTGPLTCERHHDRQAQGPSAPERRTP